jgi:hypothetical protein
MSKTIHVVTRPSIVVVATNESRIGETRYDAANINIVRHDGRYCLSFICSGEITLIPVPRVKAIEFYADGAQWCISCDGQLTSWPCNDPGYHKEYPADTAIEEARG